MKVTSFVIPFRCRVNRDDFTVLFALHKPSAFVVLVWGHETAWNDLYCLNVILVSVF